VDKAKSGTKREQRRFLSASKNRLQKTKILAIVDFVIMPHKDYLWPLKLRI
jgi:hypothetical protein